MKRLLALLIILSPISNALAQSNDELTVGNRLVWQPEGASIDLGPSRTQGGTGSELVLIDGILTPSSDAPLRSTGSRQAQDQQALAPAAPSSVSLAAGSPINQILDDLVRVDAGCYRSISNIGALGPQVCVEAFSIMRNEVTNEQYRLFNRNHRSGSFSDLSLDGDQQPVVNISIEEARQFAQWISEVTERDLRLPTPQQWEYAARGDVSSSTYWGSDIAVSCVYANVADASLASIRSDWDRHSCNDQFSVSAPVGSFRPNAYGLFDMIGNVWEWVDDPQTESSISKGGAWASSESSANSSYIYVENEFLRRPIIGIRLVSE